jgi:hypothetical protein
MKNTNSLFIIIALILFSCSNNEEEISISLEDNAFNCQDTAVNDPTYSGTICCIQRNSDLDINSVVEYEYTTNLDNIIYQWEILDGEIEIISGANSNIVRIIFKDNFTNASLKCRSSGVSGVCDNSVNITRTTN